ncbi:AsmA family protein [Actibacterium sp. XHP0104]|uniref:AsmA family protein n=1 Tax=Actibacterium sp. XHP0104 TaxID=2984335 RepID=UPI0021E79E30|nr:AsmA-like C-terminal region-containing protein [Actibacterium sp. XHP0104]MCV2882942.1 AsmA family protein [Actibacterium sp. XHP0104]
MRWLIRAFVAVVLLVVLLIGAVFLLPADKIADLAGDQIRKATGRELTLEGRLKPSIWPQIGVTTGAVSISNADWASDTPMLRAEALEIGLDLGALMGGDIVIRKIALTRPEILLEKGVDDRVNWQFGESTGTETGAGGAGGSAGGGVTLDIAQVTDASLTFVNHAAKTREHITGLNATMRLPAANGPLDLEFDGSVNGQPVKGAVHLARLSDQLNGAVAETRLSVDLGGSSLRFDGQAGLSPVQANGAFQADLGDLPALMAALNQPAPAHSKFTQGLSAKGDLAYGADGRIGLNGANIRFGPNALAGNATISLDGPRPRLVGQFASGTLDLRTGSSSGDGGGGAGGKGGGGWSNAPIDVSALGALDAELGLSADSLLLDGATMGPTRLTATLTDRRLVLDLHQMAAYEGQITGNFVINGRGGLSVGGDLSLAGIAMRPALNELADYDRLSARADMRVNFLGSGPSMAAIMSGLSGSGNLDLGEGEFRGLDLLAIFLQKAEGAQDGARTIFHDVKATFAIKNGILRNDDLSLTSDRFTALGEGQVNLGKQTMDYRLVPQTLLGGEGGKALKIPLRIVGPWAKPSLRLDLDAVIDARKDKAKEELTQKAAEKLGVQTQEGESLEDAAKRKLEEKAKKKLEKLFQ